MKIPLEMGMNLSKNAQDSKVKLYIFWSDIKKTYMKEIIVFME